MKTVSFFIIKKERLRKPSSRSLSIYMFRDTILVGYFIEKFGCDLDECIVPLCTGSDAFTGY